METENRLLIRGKHLLTMGPAGALRDGAVLIDGDQITAVGPFAELSTDHPEVPVAGDAEAIVMPGLINAHTHFSEGLIPGMCEDLTIWEWAVKLLTPTGAVMTREMACSGTLLKGAELLYSGVTTVNDMFCHTHYPEHPTQGVVDALEALGLRGMVSYGSEDLYGAPPKALDLIFAEQEALRARVDRNPLLTFALGIGTVLGQTDQLFRESIRYAEKHRSPVHTHLAEVREEKVTARLRWGRSTVEHGADTGLFALPVIAGHGIWMVESERQLLRAGDVAIIHNPQANMILGSGVCDVGTLLRHGLRLGLGTDGAASNDSHNMLEVAKLAGLLQKVHAIDPAVIDAQTVLEMATIRGARALRLDGVTGSLEVGKQADIITFSTTSPGTAVVHNPFQQVVYGSSPRDVADVWVAGRQRLRDGALVDLDIAAIAAEARREAAKLATAANLKEISCLTSQS